MSGAKSRKPDPAANLPVNAVTKPNEREEQQSAASPSRVALAVKGWRCFVGWHRWNVCSVVGRYVSGRGFDGAYEVFQECARCGEERSYMEWNRRVGAKLEEAVRGR